MSKLFLRQGGGCCDWKHFEITAVFGWKHFEISAKMAQKVRLLRFLGLKILRFVWVVGEGAGA